MRLLLVEDDTMIGETLLDVLRADHFAVDWVKDGQMADTALRNPLPPRAVLGFSDLTQNGARYRVYSVQAPLQTACSTAFFAAPRAAPAAATDQG